MMLIAIPNHRSEKREAILHKRLSDIERALQKGTFVLLIKKQGSRHLRLISTRRMRLRSETIMRTRCELWNFVEKSPRILEQIHALARSFEDGVCSKLANTETETTAFKAFRSQEEKEETILGTKSIQRSFSFCPESASIGRVKLNWLQLLDAILLITLLFPSFAAK